MVLLHSKLIGLPNVFPYKRSISQQPQYLLHSLLQPYFYTIMVRLTVFSVSASSFRPMFSSANV